MVVQSKVIEDKQSFQMLLTLAFPTCKTERADCNWHQALTKQNVKNEFFKLLWTNATDICGSCTRILSVWAVCLGIMFVLSVSARHDLHPVV